MSRVQVNFDGLSKSYLIGWYLWGCQDLQVNFDGPTKPNSIKWFYHAWRSHFWASGPYEYVNLHLRIESDPYNFKEASVSSFSLVWQVISRAL